MLLHEGIQENEPVIRRLMERWGRRNVLVSFQAVPKLGVYPQATHHDPRAQYWYPMSWLRKNLDFWTNFSNQPWVLVAQVDEKDPGFLDLGKVDDNQAKKLAAAAGIGERHARLPAKFSHPGSRLWRAMEAEMAARDYQPLGYWNTMLKKMGVWGVRDARGIIASQEPSQVLIIDPSKVKVLDVLQAHPTSGYSGHAAYMKILADGLLDGGWRMQGVEGGGGSRVLVAKGAKDGKPAALSLSIGMRDSTVKLETEAGVQSWLVDTKAVEMINTPVERLAQSALRYIRQHPSATANSDPLAHRFARVLAAALGRQEAADVEQRADGWLIKKREDIPHGLDAFYWLSLEARCTKQPDGKWRVRIVFCDDDWHPLKALEQPTLITQLEERGIQRDGRALRASMDRALTMDPQGERLDNYYRWRARKAYGLPDQPFPKPPTEDAQNEAKTISQPPGLWHTTSYGGLQDILKSLQVEPRTSEDYVSFSDQPLFHGDIRHKQVALGFVPQAMSGQLEPVEYSEDWYDEHRAQARYIAGEGWREQYTEPEWLWEPPDGWDEERDGQWEPEEEDVEAAEREAELDAFQAHENEHESISREPGEAVKFQPRELVKILVYDQRMVRDVRKWLPPSMAHVQVSP